MRHTTITAINEATPLSRNRYMDSLRLFSMLTVVLGHWLLAVVFISDGQLGYRNLLSDSQLIQFLTWVLQVMPLFFIVGGYANAASWESAISKGTTYGQWLAARTGRLVRPTLVFVSVWVPVGAVLRIIGSAGLVDAEAARIAAHFVAVPLWFLAVYILAVASAPHMYRLHRRYGVKVLAALIPAAIALDALTHVAQVPSIGYLSYPVVWFAIHQFGFFIYDGAMSRSRGITVGFVGLVALTLLTVFGPYPISMVGVPGESMTNTSNPTVALIALAMFQVGLMTVGQPVADRWLARPKPWAHVVVASSVAMTIYLWHMTALMLTVGASMALGGVGLTLVPLSTVWWVSRPMWFIILAIPLAALVKLFARFEEPVPAGQQRSTPQLTGLAAVALSAGLVMIVLFGFGSVAFPLGPIVGLGLLLIGSAAIGMVPRRA